MNISEYGRGLTFASQVPRKNSKHFRVRNRGIIHLTISMVPNAQIWPICRDRVSPGDNMKIQKLQYLIIFQVLWMNQDVLLVCVIY